LVGMTEEEATHLCPQIKVFPKLREGQFREESDNLSDKIITLCQKFDITIEKTGSIDLFLDLTTFCDEYVIQNEDYIQDLDVVVECGVRRIQFKENKSLHHTKWTEAAVFMSDLCDYIFDETRLKCGVGISFNKHLAKMLHKYNMRFNTSDNISIIASKAAIARVLGDLPLRMCDQLGGKMGSIVEEQLKKPISTLKELREFRREHLKRMFRKQTRGRSPKKEDNTEDKKKEFGHFLWDVCRGIDSSPVKNKETFDTISVSQSYPSGIDSKSNQILIDLNNKCKELEQRLAKDLQSHQRIFNNINVIIEFNSLVFFQ